MKNTVFLNTNREMPLLGLGVYKATGENEAEHAIVSAVENGYRLIDTASVYKNEENVGRGIAQMWDSQKRTFCYYQSLEHSTASWRYPRSLRAQSGPPEAGLCRSLSDPLAGSRMLSEHLESSGRNPEIRTCPLHRSQQF